MKHLTPFIIFFLIPVFFSSKITYVKKSNAGKVVTSDSTVKVTLSFVGDLMCHSPQYNFAKVDEDSFDFTRVFSQVKSIFSRDDLTIGNLETVTAGKSVGYSGYPFFNTPDEFIYALAESGFDILVTANNHALDQGEKGLLRTIEKINEFGMMNSGTYGSKPERESINIINLKGLKIVLLSYTQDTNGMIVPNKKEYLLNRIDFKMIADDIQRAREKDVDIIIAHFHYGPEYNREPDSYQKSVVDSVIKFGADLVIGGHPHVVQPIDYFKTNGGKLETGIVAYSLGNFVSNQRWRYSDAGIILSIDLKKNFTNGSVCVSEVNYLPTWVFKGNTEWGREYIVFPAQFYQDSTITYLSREDKHLMEEAFNDTKEITTKYNSGIKLIEK
jgi:poly-gamma-glutamate synthesis protein (capsule biosynthesis protein)